MIKAKRALSGFSILRRRAEEEAATLPALMAEAEKAAHAIIGGEHTQRKSGTGEKFWQYREYNAGDRPQDIDWRQSAKGDRVFIRQKEWQTAQTALMWVAGGADMHYRSNTRLPEKKDAAATLALALTLLLTRAGERVGLLDGSVMPGRGEASLQKLGQAILESAQTRPPPTARIPHNAGLVLVGDFLESPDQLESSFSSLAERSATAQIIQVLDPAELSLPFSGRLIFSQPGNPAERHQIANAESVRVAYEARMKEHIAGVKALCHRYRWNWALHVTDQPVRDTLHDIWMLMAPGGRI